MLKLIWFMTLSCLVAMLNGTSVLISVPSKAGPYYRNDNVSITCSYTALPSPATGALLLQINTSAFGCSFKGSNGMFEFVNNYTVAVSPETLEICGSLPSATSLPTNHSQTLNFSVIDTGPYTCIWTYFGQTTSSSQINLSPLSPLYDKPLNLTITVTPSPLNAGVQARVICSSAGGYPAPNFNYSVGSELIPSGTFTATRSHNSLIVSCVDVTHSPYLGDRIGVTTAQAPLIVYYLEAERDCYHPNSTSEPVALRVISHLPQNVNLTFNWTKNGVPLAGENAIYSAHYINQSVDVYTCSVLGYHNGPKQLTFYVVWDNSTCNPISSETPSDSPVTPSPSADTSVGLSEAAKIGIGVGVPFGLILVTIIVVVLIYYLKREGKLPAWGKPTEGGNKRKRNEQPAVAETENGLSSPKKNAVHPRKAARSGQIPLQNPKDSEVVYSEVQKGNNGAGRNKLPPLSNTVDPSQVNPERQLIYAEIDHSGSKAERKPPRQNQPVLYAQIDLARTQNIANAPH